MNTKIRNNANRADQTAKILNDKGATGVVGLLVRGKNQLIKELNEIAAITTNKDAANI